MKDRKSYTIYGQRTEIVDQSKYGTSEATISDFSVPFQPNIIIFGLLVN